MTEGFRVALARRRVAGVMASLSGLGVDQQTTVIADTSSVEWNAFFGCWVGGLFDLELIVDNDRRFVLPGRSRRATEAILAAAAPLLAANLEWAVRAQSEKRHNRTKNILISVGIGALGVLVFWAGPQIIADISGLVR